MTYLVDTNLVIRFITGSPGSQAQLAADFLKKGDRGEFAVQFSPIVIAEVVFVLTGKVYSYPRAAVVKHLLEFIQNPSFKVLELEVLIEALGLFRAHKIDFAGAYLAASAKQSGATVASFDKDFKKIKGLNPLILK